MRRYLRFQRNLQRMLPLVPFVLGLVAFPVTASEPDFGRTAEIAPSTDSSRPAPALVNVSTTQQLRAVLKDVQPGTTIRIAPGTYSRGIFMAGIDGTLELPIIITAADPANPPVLSGTGEGAKLTSCSYVKLSSLTFTGFSNNGINIDDGGNIIRPSHHIILEALDILDTSPQGNHDALKMSGVDHFVVRNCRFENWGGSAIDLVGCHLGIIESSRFIGREGTRTKNAVQIKGGSSEILVQTSFFQDAGERIINLGGATGLDYFRPANATYEAANVVVAGNRFVGGETHIAWVTSRDSHVHHNLFYLPQKWVGRILQETKDLRFKTCQVGLFEDNLIVADDRVRSDVDVGAGTDPSTFAFRHNAWHRRGTERKPALPTSEIEGIYGIDPQLEDEGTATMRIGSRQSRLRSIGPDAYEPWSSAADFANVSVPAVRWMPPPTASASRSKYFACVLLAVLMVAAAVAFKRWNILTRPGIAKWTGRIVKVPRKPLPSPGPEVAAAACRTGLHPVQTGYRPVLQTLLILLSIGVYAYAVGVLVVWALLWLAGDRWWFATLLLLGPRWVYLLPMMVLLPPALFWRRRWLWPLGLSAVIIVWPIMGLNVPVGALMSTAPARLRVLTYNIQRYSVSPDSFAALLDEFQPDLVAIQECAGVGPWELPEGWNVQQPNGSELRIASRYPMSPVEISRCLWPPSEGNGVINGLYCTVETPYGPVGFACIHLDTPKPALQLILDPRKVLDFSQVENAENDLDYRRRETEDMTQWLDRFPNSKIIAGDFNMPVEGGLYQDYWARYRNAFSQAGFGFGHTKHTRVDRFIYGARIDHVVTSPELNAVRCRVGPDLGSDHLPLIADIAIVH